MTNDTFREVCACELIGWAQKKLNESNLAGLSMHMIAGANLALSISNSYEMAIVRICCKLLEWYTERGRPADVNDTKRKLSAIISGDEIPQTK